MQENANLLRGSYVLLYLHSKHHLLETVDESPLTTSGAMCL